MEKIIIILYNTHHAIQKYELQSFIQVYTQHRIKFSLCFKSTCDRNLQQEKLNRLWIELFSYEDDRDLDTHIDTLHKEKSIVFIDTFYESYVDIVHMLREKYGLPFTSQHTLFQDKNLQRNILKESKQKDFLITSEKIRIQDTTPFSEIEESFNLPVIMKPNTWVGSSKVVKIHSSQDFDAYKNLFLDSWECLVEEYIDGEMYSIDYFVDENQNFYCSPIIEMKLWKDLWVKDFFVYSCSVNNDMSKIIPLDILENMIQDTIKTCGIKNSFIHHEFKYSSQKQLKTIEVNARIWGRRLKILQAGYAVNIYKLMFQKQSFIDAPIQNCFSAFALYPQKTWILKAYNKELLEKIQSLASFQSLDIDNHYVGNKIWLTRDGFWNAGMIYLQHPNKEIFQKDYDFIEKNYCDILILE